MLNTFQNLTDLNIKNAYTFSNKTWGSMRLSHSDHGAKYTKLFKLLGIPFDKNLIYMAPEHSDAVQIVTAQNLKMHIKKEKNDFQNDKFNPIILNYDSIITKEQIPLVVTPADCSIICISGIDESDQKQFIAMIHAGSNGTVLEIHLKTLDLLHHYYKFSNEDLNVSVFPSISAKNYLHDKNQFFHQDILNDMSYFPYIMDFGDKIGFDIEKKIVDDFLKHGINKIYTTGLCTYEENIKGNLYSHTHQKQQKSNNGLRFGVVMSL